MVNNNPYGFELSLILSGVFSYVCVSKPLGEILTFGGLATLIITNEPLKKGLKKLKKISDNNYESFKKLS